MKKKKQKQNESLDIIPKEEDLQDIYQKELISLPVENQKSLIQTVYESLKQNKQVDLSSVEPRGLFHLARLVYMKSTESEPVVAEMFRQASSMGDDQSALALASMIKVGSGIEKDEKKALEIYESLALKGNPIAQVLFLF